MYRVTALLAAPALVVCVAGASATVRADPSFAPGRALATGAVAGVTDLNRDGKLDLVIALPSSLTTLVGRGGGRLGVAATVKGKPPLAWGDFTGDGVPDVAAATSAHKLSVLPGNGEGGFGAALGTAVTLPGKPAGAAAGDLNGDGRLDLVVAVEETKQPLTVLLGQASGGLAPASGTPRTLTVSARTIGIADFDEDGKQDLALGGIDAGTAVMLGDGAGHFRAGTPVAGGILLGLADFNSDGRADLAVATVAPDDVSLQAAVLIGDGNATFHAAGASVGIGPGQFSHAAIGDVDGDGAPDLALASDDGLRIFLGNGKGGLRQITDGPFPLASCKYCGNAWPADFDGDGRVDLAVSPVAYWVGNVSIMFQTR